MRVHLHRHSTSSTPRKSRQRSWHPAWRLGLGMVVIAIVWLVVLPRLARREATARYLEMLDRQGIDASAKFYTDLEFMRPSR